MQLKQLLEFIKEPSVNFDCEIKGLALNSQQIKPFFAFLAVKGHAQDGREFMTNAVKNRASVIFAEARGLQKYLSDFKCLVPVIPIENLSSKIGLIASYFHQTEQAAPITVGITGTNGKTTCSFLMTQALNRLNCKSGLIGTLGFGMAGQLLENQSITTPDAITMHRNYAVLVQEQAKVIAIETSSHGLDQDRLSGLKITSAIFTNLTQDHLDYHGHMDHYLNAKCKLFQRAEIERAIINLDSPYFDKILDRVNLQVPTYLYSLQVPYIKPQDYPDKKIAFVYAKEYTMHKNGIEAYVVTPWGEGILRSPLMGGFNLSNLLAVITELCAQGHPLKEVLSALYAAIGAPGRMQRLGRSHLPEVIVDYAHTPDALEKALLAARQHCKRRLWCVFGCGGGRDKEKRKLMGSIASKWADKVVITNDNPRLEPPLNIINDIMQGIESTERTKISIEEDRKKAIEYAIAHALSVDTILIAGKGHEDYQELGQERIPFNDLACVEAIFSEGG